ncbi:hypothetical protein [Deinococcus ruber]|uniref:Uncharacterized protein n=1 Tax=Deinococcus ruber TaxID=1848197 RepID=A0A918CMX6_9DEIO|nr:hypothetical protein [Deinococcus ruber]GGR31024.1 hypothetical protein GCM10008957_47220 [Deinococcus ruber]
MFRSRSADALDVRLSSALDPSLLISELAVAETRVLGGQTLSEDDWQRLLDAGAEVDTLHDVQRRSVVQSLSLLGKLSQRLHRTGHPRHEVLMAVLRRALIDGALQPHVLVLRAICAAPPSPWGRQATSWSTAGA